MTILTLDEWWWRLPIRTEAPTIEVTSETVETVGGAIQVVERSPRIWQWEIALGDRALGDGRELEALIDLASTGGAVVEASPVAWRDPALDPGGTAASLASVTVASVSADGWSLTLAGLAPDYTLSAGDWLSVEVPGTSGGRIVRLYRLAQSGSAAADGTLGPVRVSPRVDGVVAAGQAVRLHEPVALAAVVPSDLRRGRLQPGRWGGASLVLRQVLVEVQP